MCGIAGIAERAGGQAGLVTNLIKMGAYLAHRGPDDEGYFLHSADFKTAATGDSTCAPIRAKVGKHIEELRDQSFSVGLAHRRLSIYDVSEAGHQPMACQNNRYQIVFNGAVYNFKELRLQLEKEGFHFISNSDTEVLLACYQHWGDRMMYYLEGMWSFVLLDTEENILFGCRDRLGVKPLYYVYNENTFAFASEQKALYSFYATDMRLSRTAAFEFLAMGHHARETTGLVKDVQELPAGNAFVFNLNTHTLKIWQYYKLGVNFKYDRFKESQYKKHRDTIKELLAQSVLKRLQADVAVGACLSGGLDSSALVCLAHQLALAQKQPFNLSTFTACFPDQSIDETDFAQLTVSKTQSPWTRVMPTAQEMVDDLEKLVVLHDLPLQTPSTYAQFRVMQAAKEKGIKVTLDGQGADEIFAGYASHYQAYLNEIKLKKKYGRFLSEMLAGSGNFSAPSLTLKRLAKVWGTQFMSKERAANLYRKAHPEYMLLRSHLWDKHIKYLDEQVGDYPNTLNEILGLHTTGPMLATHLRLADRNSMYHGVEARAPFADSTALFEYAFQLSGIYKIRNGRSKALLRSALKGLVPDEVINRKDKIGFQAPVNAWIKELAQACRPFLTHDLDEFINTKQLLGNLDNLVNRGAAGDPLPLWRLLSFSAWYHLAYKPHLTKG